MQQPLDVSHGRKKTEMSELTSRRSFLQAVLVSPQLLGGHGKITPPVPVPDLALTRHDGMRTTLLRHVRGRATAIHLMFASCTTTCPLQAAIFRKVQDRLPNMGKSGMQLLSLTIDPANDTPRVLSEWLRHYHAGPDWIAAAPRSSDVPQLQGFFGKTSGSSDHSTQVHILDRSGNLVWRTYELPTPEEIAGILKGFAAKV
jgi:protein SCO1